MILDVFKMHGVNELMSILESGQWLNFETIISICSLQECNIKLVLNFLSIFDLLQMNEDKQLFRLHPSMVKLANGIQ
jgi:hypothetical protein